MLEMSQTTTHTIITADENDGDFLDLSAFAGGASFSLSAWAVAGPCHAPAHEEEEVNENTATTVPLSWRRSTYETTHSDSWSVSSSENDKRVRFSAEICQVRMFDKPTSDDWNQLYYSCHELQKIVDEYRLEQEEFEEKCAALEQEGAREEKKRKSGVPTPENEALPPKLRLEKEANKSDCLVEQQITVIQKKLSTGLLITSKEHTCASVAASLAC